MANEAHLAKLGEGVEAWNAWRKENPAIRPDLVEASLEETKLNYLNLNHANLSGAKLFAAKFLITNLIGANFSRADLRKADFGAAHLLVANLSGAILGGTEFTVADLSGANLSQARLSNTIFGRTALAGAIGLDDCIHEGPSNLDPVTVEVSGNLPEDFLRGCGWPERLIEYWPSISEQAIQFYSCFISYATVDKAFANRLHADLRNESVRCWFAPEDLKIGDELRLTFDQAIRLRDKLLVILSKVSLTRPWVKREVEQAFDEEERRGELVLFPIRLDDAIFGVTEGWATDLKRRHIGDFTNWKDHDSYQAAFDRLLRDLRQAPEDPATAQ